MVILGWKGRSGKGTERKSGEGRRKSQNKPIKTDKLYKKLINDLAHISLRIVLIKMLE
jgi:hypothetical protein